MTLLLSIIRASKAWQGHKCTSKPFIKSIVSRLLLNFPNFNLCEEIEVVLLLTDNAQMQILNNEFRSKNKPTNVLSFPDQELDYKTILEFTPPEDYINLGDIAFGYEIIKQEAEEEGKIFEHHFAHLFVHGLLHLIGFDHEKDEDAKVMKDLEIKILKDLSIASPY